MNLNGGLFETKDTITSRKWPLSHMILFRELAYQAVQYSAVQNKHGPVHHAQKQSQQKR